MSKHFGVVPDRRYTQCPVCAAMIDQSTGSCRHCGVAVEQRVSGQMFFEGVARWLARFGWAMFFDLGRMFRRRS